MRRKISPKFHVKNGVKNGKFHANFTLLGRSAERFSGMGIAKIAKIAAANGGVTNGGLRAVWLHFLAIGRNRPFPPFFCLVCPFPEGAKSTWEIQKTQEKGLFPQISSDFLKPPSLKPPLVALQAKIAAISVRYLENPVTSLNKEVRPFFLGDNSIWSFPLCFLP